jgi:hypothetical protein
MPGTASARRERDFLLALQARFLRYFLDNQIDGLILDRQSNFGPRRSGLCSTSATGMGFICLALAATAPYHLIGRREAIARIRRGLQTCLEKLPQTAGVLPHFVQPQTNASAGADARSTIDTGWLAAGALWSADFVADGGLQALAARLFDRINWTQWTAANGLLRHGADRRGRPFPCCWDRLNSETAFLYVLAAGARDGRCWPAEHFSRLGRFSGQVAGAHFGSADLGLFVFQYSLALLDLKNDPLPGADLVADAVLAAQANARVCREASARFHTYRRFWGLSAGDGPGAPPNRDTYRAYSPADPLDGTAHVTATLASIEHCPALVWENLCGTERDFSRLAGRYGFGNINLDRSWVGRDMVGIDAGAAALALDNYLLEGRVRRVFHRLPVVLRGLRRIRNGQLSAAA